MAPVPDRTPIRLVGVRAERGSRMVLDDLSVTFPQGAVTALVGPNGSGKSTVLDVVAGVLRPAAGRVTGVPGGGVAYVAQAVPPSGLPLTVRTVVRMGQWPGRRWWRPLGRTGHRIVEEQLERLDIAGLADRPFDQLSGGQRQRVLVALGLAQCAPVLLVDEPTAGVDTRSSELVLAALAEAATTGVAVVHAAHDRAAIDAADRVVVLS